jgi:Methylamine utilisation protein MauE
MMLLGSCGYLVLIAVLGVSAAAKLRHPRVLAGQIERYRIVPRRLARPAGMALALTEAAAVLLLAGPGSRLAGLLLAGSLTGLFLAAMSLALARGQRIPCACFGGTGELDTVGRPSLLRAALLGVVIAASLLAQTSAPRPAAGFAVQVLVAALVLVLVFLLAETARLWPSRSVAPAAPQTAGGRA